MLILGLDPGMAETGWGIIRRLKTNPSSAKRKSENKNGFETVSYGCIKTFVGQSLPQRLLVLRNELQQIIRKYEPDCLAIEQLFFGRNSKTAMIVGLARGVTMVTAAEKDIPVFEYQGLRVKLNLAGHGRCSKRGMQSAVRRILNLRSLPRPQHASDALAVAIYHVLEKEKLLGEKDVGNKKKK